MMLCLVLYLNKSSSTSVTAIGLLSRVDAGMGLEIGWSIKLCPAHITAIWLIT